MQHKKDGESSHKLELKKERLGGFKTFLISFFFTYKSIYKGGNAMIINLKIVRVNSDYCDYLRKFDNKVAYNKHEKELRPFIGILFKIENCEYFAPLASPKEKHIILNCQKKSVYNI